MSTDSDSKAPVHAGVSTATKLVEVASRINDHLKRFEDDKKINTEKSRYYQACSWAAGRYVGVRYVSYQGNSHLPKAEAIAYLTWLEAGNVGKHWKLK